jgi:hypothetical protein
MAPVLTSLAELLRLKLPLLLPDRLTAPDPLPPAAAGPAVADEAAESVERRGMGASTLKKRLSANTVWIQVRVFWGFLQGGNDSSNIAEMSVSGGVSA